MENLLAEVLDKKIIAIIRGVGSEDIVNVGEALYRGGIRFMEVTFNASSLLASEDTLESIRRLRERLAGRMHIGAGTVLTAVQADLARDAGAEFIISPDTNPEVILRTKELGLLSMPGALTPTEVQNAWTAGADIVKIFPSSVVGPSYFKSLKSPLSQVKLAAVGGVDETNIESFLKAGADAFGIGGSLVSNDQVARKAWDEIEQHARQYTSAICLSPK